MKYRTIYILIVSLIFISCQKKQKVKSHGEELKFSTSMGEKNSKILDRTRTSIAHSKKTDANFKKLERSKAKWISLRGSNWPESFDSKIDFPRKKNSSGKGKKSLMNQIFSKNFDGDFQTVEKEQLVKLHQFAKELAVENSQALPYILLDGAQNPSVTQGDVYIYKIFTDAYYGDQKKNVLSTKEEQAWVELANSPNPVYRRLALHSYRRAVLAPEKWLNFYEEYVDDNEPLITEELISFIVETANPEGVGILNQIKKNQSKLLKENISLEEKIDVSISWLKTLPNK